MRSNYFATLTVLLFGTDLVMTETTGESKEQLPTNHKFKKTSIDIVPYPDTWEVNPSLNTMWAYRPAPVQSHHPGDVLARRTVLKNPHFLTRLAKTVSSGYDPQFEKDFFEPFERRQRPVTLVAFRKSGLMPGNRDETVSIQDTNVAELQSPFNEIGTFWQEDA